MRTLHLIVAASSFAAFFGACGPGMIFETGPHIRGRIEAIIPAQVAEDLGFVRIEGKREADTEYDRADVAITKATIVTRRAAGAEETWSFDSLRVGQRIEATFTGPVMESYPVRATAQRVVILE